MTDLTDGWQARVLDTHEGFMHDLRTLIVFRAEGDDLVALAGWTDTGTPVLTRWPRHAVSPDSTRLQLPVGVLEAIAEAIKPGPSQGELARLEEALTVERTRIDRVLERNLPAPHTTETTTT